jgi:hypothetical protein
MDSHDRDHHDDFGGLQRTSRQPELRDRWGMLRRGARFGGGGGEV